MNGEIAVAVGNRKQFHINTFKHTNVFETHFSRVAFRIGVARNTFFFLLLFFFLLFIFI